MKVYQFPATLTYDALIEVRAGSKQDAVQKAFEGGFKVLYKELVYWATEGEKESPNDKR
jgi:hypothetical protein